MKRETVLMWLVLFLVAFVVGSFAVVCYLPLDQYDRDREQIIRHELP